MVIFILFYVRWNFSSLSNNNNESEKKLPSMKLSNAEWKKKLTDQQYRILRLKETEYPGTGEYNKANQTGIYRCAACGEELYQ